MTTHTYDDKKPKFDPNKPYQPVDEAKPKFDPNKPFDAVKKKEPSLASPTPSSSGGQLSSSEILNPFSYDKLPDLQQEPEKPFIQPRPIARAVEKDKKKDDSVMGGVWNMIVGSVSRATGGMVETLETLDKPLTRGVDKLIGREPQDPTKVVWGPGVDDPTGRQLVTQFIEKARTASSSKENEQARSQFDITNGVQKSDVKALLFNAPSAILDMVGGAYTAGTSFFFQAVNDNAKELEENPNAKKLTENQKLSYLFIQGTVQAALEKFSIDKLLKATGLSSKVKQKIANEVTDELIKKGVKATAKEIEELALKKATSLSSKIKRVGVKAATSTAIEGTTEGLQSAASDGIKLLTNKIVKNDIFDEEDITENFIKNSINAAAQGGVFGGAIGGGVGVMTNTNKAIRSEIANAQTPEDLQRIQTEINEQVELGNITEEEAKAANITAQQYANMAAKIPTELDADTKYKLIGGIEQREGLKKEIEKVKGEMKKVDPAFHDDQKSQIELLEAKLEQTNDYLEGIVYGKKPTYRKEKPATEGGEEKYYKTSPTGEEIKITKEHYDLATAVRESEAEKNKQPKDEDELLTSLKENAPDIQKGESIQYFIDKAAEDPAAFMDVHGKKITKQLLEKVPTKKLIENRDYLVNNFDESESTDFLTQIISQRNDKDEAVDEISQPIELDPNLPNDYQLPTQHVPSPQVNIPELQTIKSEAQENTQNNEPTEAAQPIELKDNEYYHATSGDKIIFPNEEGYKKREGPNVVNQGVYFGKDKQHLMDSYGSNAIKVSLDIKNPLRIDNKYVIVDGREIDFQSLSKEDISFLKDKGYDAIEFKMPSRTPEFIKWDETVVFDKSQVKESSPKKETPVEAETTPETIGTTEEGGAVPPTKAVGEGDAEQIRLAHADTERIYEEAGLPLRLETPTKHRDQLEREADDILAKGYDFNRVAEETMEGKRKWEDTDQVLFARKVADLKAKQRNVDIQSPEFDRLQNEIEKLSRASDVAGTISARHLESRKGYRPVEESISDFVAIEKGTLGVDELTPIQKDNLKKEYDDLQKAKTEFEEYRAKKEAELATKEAESKVSEIKATTKKTKKTHEDYVKERKDIIEHLKEKLRQSRGEASATIVPYAKELFAIAPDVAKLTKSLVEEGISKLDDIVKNIHSTLKESIPDVTEKDVRDIIAGNYNEKKATRNELSAKLVDLKREASLLNKLDALFKEPEPTTESKRIERNQRIAELKKQIKDIQSFEKEVESAKEEKAKLAASQVSSTEKELTKAEKEIDTAEAKKAKQEQLEAERQRKKELVDSERERKRQIAEAERERKQLEREFEKEKRAEEKAKLKAKLEVARRIEKELSYRTPEEKALDNAKSKIKSNIEKVEKQIREGDFSEPAKKQPIKLDEEGHKLRDRFMQLKQQRDARVLLNQRMSETGNQKGMRLFTEVLGIPRTLMTIGDFSALLRQNIFFTAGHPLMTFGLKKGDKWYKPKGEGAFWKGFHSAWSQKAYDRWFADLQENPRYQVMKDSKLSIADSLSHDLTEREEAFMSTIAEKLPVVGNMKIKGVPVGLNIVKGSERSYTMLLNKMRVDMFDALAAKMEERGLTFENSPKQYKALAEYINNATGRSDFGKTLNRIAPVLNNTFFSPRLIASRMNMLTYFAQPRFWRTLPREARIDYVRNWASLLFVGGIILTIAKMGGADVEEDPRSSDFGKIKSGDTRWDIWGGAQPYLRAFAQVVLGQRKSTKSGKIYELNGDDIFGETRWGVASDFFRNKLAPIPGAAVDILSGRTSVGDKIVYQWGGENGKEISISEYIRQRLLPMTITGTQEALKDQGVKALLTVGIPNVFGVGTQTYDSKPSGGGKSERTKPQREKKD